ncbi:MAG: DUF1273 domain-containing protein [Oscillospiraceae bacterium]|jgi:uncharacterized phage-like protein YoqJ|nr:DUF1273 domain-containing protein [Oscillospiraceae bacterium]
MKTEFTRQQTVCFSGYRPEKLPWGYDETDTRCRELKRRLFHIAEALYVAGKRKFICGMARGCDTFFCEAALTLRDIHADVFIEAAIPCQTQANAWAAVQRARYFDLLSRCDAETFISRAYTRDCMMQRNRYMVDSSSVIVTVFDGRFGGTMATRKYAERCGLEIIDLMP